MPSSNKLNIVQDVKAEITTETLTKIITTADPDDQAVGDSCYTA